MKRVWGKNLKGNDEQGKRRLPSLQYRIIIVLVASWIIPIAVMSFFIFFQYQNAYVKRTEKQVENAVDVSGVLVKAKLDDAISKLYKLSIGGEFERKRLNVKTGSLSKEGYLTWMRSQLISKFYMDSQFSSVAFYYAGDTEPSSYSGKNGYEYEKYMGSVNDVVLKTIDEKNRLTSAVVAGNEIYLVQNLYMSTYGMSYGTIVTALNKANVFEDIPFEDAWNVVMTINGRNELLTVGSGLEDFSGARETILCELMENEDMSRTGQDFWSMVTEGYEGYKYSASGKSYDMSLFYLKDTRELYAEIIRLNKIVFLTLFFMIPAMIFCYRFIDRNIEKPLTLFKKASKQISGGDFGARIDTDKMPNSEFNSMAGSFNAMSEQIKYLFETVYMERIATRDAKIAALQSQINPHFLNNTLEMMNWQARMSGDKEISKMIEALGTVLDSGINRNNDRLVRLSDELKCADAFLYIMSMRFGARLKVEKLVDQELMDVMVPQLILQPILENAIKHGVESISEGAIWLNIFGEGDNLIIDVINTGKPLSDEMIERIRQIITGEYKTPKSEPGVHTSIGIYNVNQRIQLIFGNSYGLSANRVDEDKLQFRIVIPMHGEVESNDQGSNN